MGWLLNYYPNKSLKAHEKILISFKLFWMGIFILIISTQVTVADALSPEQVLKIKFEQIEIKLGKKKIKVELADTDIKRQAGLMYRHEISKNKKNGVVGMLFKFEREQILSFWMKNTFIDLDIGFFDVNKKLIDIQEMQAVRSESDVGLPSYTSRYAAKYALEVPKAWFKKNKISLGTYLDLSPD